jgi:DNA-binding MurR/RpiR family transcriptional regulator
MKFIISDAIKTPESIQALLKKKKKKKKTIILMTNWHDNPLTQLMRTLSCRKAAPKRVSYLIKII